MSTKLIAQILIILVCSNIIVFPPRITAQLDQIFNGLFGGKNNVANDKTGLSVGFYNNKCPHAEDIVRDVVRKAIIKDFSIAPALLRLQFHDCFVNGCDASVLLDSTPSGEPTEITAKANIGLKGIQIIDQAKSALEAACPGVVSCADTIAFATRDAVHQAGLASYPVLAGRRDGVTSSASNVPPNLPRPNATVAEMEAVFTKKHMSLQEMVTLFGAHSIGEAHCFFVDKNLYNYDDTGKSNPNMDQMYVSQMKSICPPPGSPKSNDTLIPLDGNLLSNTLSNIYYQNVANGRVALVSDLSLNDDPRTRDMVRSMSMSPRWGSMFEQAMVKLGTIDVLTGQAGQIRKSCHVVNK